MHVKCLPDARVSLLVGDDGTLRAFAQHLLENFMRFASAKPPPYRPLGCCLARKEISRTMRNDLLSVELRADNYQGSLLAPGAVDELEEQRTLTQQARAAAAPCKAMLRSQRQRPSLPCVCL